MNIISVDPGAVCSFIMLDSYNLKILAACQDADPSNVIAKRGWDCDLLVVETPDAKAGIPSRRAKGLYTTFLQAGRCQGIGMMAGCRVAAVSPERVRYDMLGIEGHPAGIDEDIEMYLLLHVPGATEHRRKGKALGNVDLRDACLTALWGKTHAHLDWTAGHHFIHTLTPKTKSRKVAV